MIWPSVVMLGLLICLWGNEALAQDVNAAMQSFVQAMKSKNVSGILASFSQMTPWKYQPYEIGTGKALKTAVVTPKQMLSDFGKKRGWHDFFLAEPNGYTFRLNFMENKPWKKRGADTFVAPDSESGKTFVTWRLEGQKWVIAAIGETTP
ncbi:MAG: hypothetical protein WAU47_04895 [Desulfobaccales bacterium]